MNQRPEKSHSNPSSIRYLSFKWSLWKTRLCNKNLPKKLLKLKMDCHKNSNSSLDTIILNSENKEYPSKKRTCEKRKCHSKRKSTPTRSTEKKHTSRKPTCISTKKECTSSQVNTERVNRSQSCKPENNQCNQAVTEKNSIPNQFNINKHTSQRIHVEKQDFQCIINLNTTVCDHKSKDKKECKIPQRSKHLTSPDIKKYIKNKDRIVPQCLRRSCYPKDMGKQQPGFYCRRNNIKCYHKERYNKPCRRYEVKYDARRKLRHGHHKKCRHGKRRCSSRILSSVSSTPLPFDDYDLVYEEISSGSLEMEKPMSYQIKHVKRYNYMHSSDDDKPSKLDTLIKRTKERERKLVEESRGNINRWLTSTPLHNELSSVDFPINNSDMDISITSRSTLVLDMKGYIYSPSCRIEELQSFETEKFGCQPYSPSSPTKSDSYPMKDTKLSDNVFKLVDIKNEPTMNIEAYSPIHTPDDLTAKLFEYSAENCVKKERKFKTEALLSPSISPIHFGKDWVTDMPDKKNVKNEIASDDCCI